jgi:hypothetical protein
MRWKVMNGWGELRGWGDKLVGGYANIPFSKYGTVEVLDIRLFISSYFSLDNKPYSTTFAECFTDEK